MEKKKQALGTSAEQNRPACNRKIRDKQNDYVFKRYKYEENRIFKEQSDAKLEQYKYRPHDQQNQQNFNLELPTQNAFLPFNIIEFDQDFEGELPQQDDSPNNVNHSQTHNLQIPHLKRQTQQSQSQPISSPFSGDPENPFNFCIPADEEMNEGGNLEEQQPVQNKSIEDSNTGLKITYKPSNCMLKTVNKKRSQRDPNRVLDQLCRKSQPQSEFQWQMQHCKLTKTEQEIKIDEDIKGLKIEVDPHSEDITIHITNKLELVQSPLPPGVTLKCTLRRSKSFFNMINPEFDLYITNGFKHILSAKKFSLKSRQLFRFSLDPGTYEGQKCIATLNANMLHNQYWLVDNKIQSQMFKRLIVAVVYEKIRKNQKERSFKAILPPVSGSVKLVIDPKANSIDRDMLLEEIKLVLQNLQGEKRGEVQSRVQNSEKNFVLFDGQDEEYHFLKLFKQSDDLFQIQIQHPLSPLQAMAIAMTRFDAQLK